ncbi:tRNA (adenine22-N1)-methyltransferase [Williamsoniiplasma somnilux]|uniref:tRNA (Adenine22-N1)-methyltransferase n=1 Tax=Williamsoniiplasma somnilux TaxID=215578 RepID=A0A2K8NZ02_9MOLU|nr:class I SAM-dependent methyltransferase [Williamsoniiplasma somnilux]ATZ18786.1 tRNA (adenine22-N1)-methyltransferase [Williamsoniiplasma somnilux]
MHISERIKLLVDILPNDKLTLADIGTDHGFLPIYAVKTNKAKMVYAVDINEGPLNSAKNNISKHDLDSQIKIILANGLDFINEKTQIIDYVTISGLGTKTMLKIIENDNEKIKNYLFCSNTEIQGLRQWAKSNDYKIEFESFIYENKKPYWIIMINKSFKFKKHDLELGDFNFYKNNLEYRSYLLNKFNYNNEIISKISKKSKSKKLRKSNKKIVRFIKLWN